MKDRLFLDTNIVLDLLGERIPHYHSIAKLATLADNGEIVLAVSALSFATVNYFLSKFEGNAKAIEKLRKFKIISAIISVDELMIEKGLNSNFTDFEDALQYFCAVKGNCRIILTRNPKDYKQSELPIMTAEEYLASVGIK
ncbi:type II toxin-antitoxin system VapC family toxin [Larkinella terrae]|uniref:PIN domain-containing protein n=1 Tax=Larkinella terrae TaxID=2025311 RepID=A0A7K0ESI2_9BACT|nr:PIN domain-containing protein [Larkinella terrae]MRS64770.1 PIN domain-containing protein [Larkinella terrae]